MLKGVFGHKNPRPCNSCRMPYALCCPHWLNSEPSRLDIHSRRSSNSPRREGKHTGGFRVAGGESESPGPGWTRASAARRPAPSPPNPPPAPLLRADRYALASGGPQCSGNRWNPARGGPRPYLPLRIRPRVARIVCPAPSAAAATTRLKGPGPERPPGACSECGRRRGWAVRAGRHAFPVPPPPDRCFPSAGARGVAGVLAAPWRRTLGERASGLPPVGPQSIQTTKSVSRPPRAAWAKAARCGAADSVARRWDPQMIPDQPYEHSTPATSQRHDLADLGFSSSLGADAVPPFLCPGMGQSRGPGLSPLCPFSVTDTATFIFVPQTCCSRPLPLPLPAISCSSHMEDPGQVHLSRLKQHEETL
ncbi:uncharacterized protein LOC123596933 [Leopardus geoffroyi]|uniref:uncharacterized protein LOC123596933 n=1 Tax=Leopardus geoffroyi TaxID=46844 RepID=UPI001E262CBA|nr:uncharacterized protein LOC123596933 [Leopardus geoffroyi]